MDTIATKRCPTCRKIKPLSDFHRSKNTLDGHVCYCKPCALARWKPMNFVWRLRTYFGITLEQYNTLLEKQDSLCAICRLPETKQGVEKLAVDHDHKTGIIRGLLCSRCNTVIGLFGEDPEYLQKALAYLQQEPPQIFGQVVSVPEEHIPGRKDPSKPAKQFIEIRQREVESAITPEINQLPLFGEEAG